MKCKLLFVIDQLEYGGAGRVASILINELASRGYDVSVITAIRYHKINYTLAGSVKVKEWYEPEPVKHGFFGRIANMYNRCKYFRRALKEVKPDVIIAFTHNIFLYTKLWSWGYKTPIIASDHTSMGRNLGRITNYIRHNFYSKADIVTILTEKDARILGERLPNKEIVYNPLTFDVFNGETMREKIVLCIGRKDHWSVKGFDRIINIWGKLYPKHTEWKLKIVGPGSEKSDKELRQMISEAGVENGVILQGNTNDMEQLYRSAEIFALPSRVEGFPLVLAEAMSQGCACVAFSMQGAISEIINDGEDGDIVEDGNLDAFSIRLEQLINNSELRNKYSGKSRHNVGRFSIKAFADKWETLINKVIK